MSTGETRNSQCLGAPCFSSPLQMANVCQENEKLVRKSQEGGSGWGLLQFCSHEEHIACFLFAPLSGIKKSVLQILQRKGKNGRGPGCTGLGLCSPVCPLILFQLWFPVHGELQLLLDDFNLLLQLCKLLHHWGPSSIQGLCFPIGC